ncbi:hypothetical protein BKA56DRAFT_635158 [Ilyonectria sp. MPI-CAGE-AT-0026]|nr:hypothetical protein BKA56DRAFT_635158 [Ilyonectria sp. MPI-CAGE-AT-0026]
MTLLLNRGRQFEKLAGYYYKFYKGTAVDAKSRQENVQSRIVIDGNSNNNDVDSIICSDQRPPLTKEQLIITSPIIQGYLLKIKYKNIFNNIMSDKRPELVAKENKVPLYIISAGNLSANIYKNTILLLNKYNIFLEAYYANNITYHYIISIFLQTLKYYKGILFLITNCIKNIDPAFLSRIYISLEYPSLDASAREAIEGEAAHEILEEEIKALAHLELNSSQIKNVLKTSNLLACHKGEKLEFRYLRIVLRVEGHSL